MKRKTVESSGSHKIGRMAMATLAGLHAGPPNRQERQKWQGDASHDGEPFFGRCSTGATPVAVAPRGTGDVRNAGSWEYERR